MNLFYATLTCNSELGQKCLSTCISIWLCFPDEMKDISVLVSALKMAVFCDMGVAFLDIPDTCKIINVKHLQIYPQL